MNKPLEEARGTVEKLRKATLLSPELSHVSEHYEEAIKEVRQESVEESIRFFIENKGKNRYVTFRDYEKAIIEKLEAGKE